MKFHDFSRKKSEPKKDSTKRQLLERKVINGANKAITEYRRVFDRLAEYDRA